ncbi:hypothetical protein DVA67_002285 [Solirubrobacter sp. CPCC 204708]|uniref:DUF4190 domain-containing protein n=1 Tax=Solirubrobacter deserti TaxID=2282478 RepID=A0ABT4RRI7_9ACTN|nr:hypothetical protein [Solirubrobacter deserti]MBE2314788.1 hypothetical protein [Solirubrobacter deserti]MDA0141198.1 hypothetical protein [Solirubrobacter deserti]
MWCGALAEDSRVLWTIAGTVAFLALLVVPLVLIARGRGVRGPLVLTWVAASVLAALAWVLAEGVWAFAFTVPAGLALGLAVSRIEDRRSPGSFALVGGFGGAGWVAILAALVLAVSAATGTCLDHL